MTMTSTQTAESSINRMQQEEETMAAARIHTVHLNHTTYNPQRRREMKKRYIWLTLFALLITIVSAPAYAQVLVNGYYVLLDDGGDFGISEGEYSRKGSSEFLAHNAVPVGVDCDPDVLDLVAAVISQNYSDVDFGTVFYTASLPDDEATLECAIELVSLVEAVLSQDYCSRMNDVKEASGNTIPRFAGIAEFSASVPLAAFECEDDGRASIPRFAGIAEFVVS